jgi:hypothetical protein
MTDNEWTYVVITAVAIGLAGACSSGGDGDDASGGAGNAGDGAGDGAAGSSGGAGTSATAGSGDSSDAGGAAGSGDEPVPVGPFYGPFLVELIAATAEGALGTPRPARTDVTAQIRDGVQPVRDGWEMIDEIGDCALFVPDVPSCIPGCDTATEICAPGDACLPIPDMPHCTPSCDTATQICAPGDACLPIPAKRTAGTVTVDGLGERFELEDKVAGNYALPLGFTLPYPPCTEGSPVTLEIEGDATGPFTLETGCVATLGAPEPVTIATGQGIELRWQAPAMPELANVHVHLDISHHGGVRGELECDTADDGELDIDVALVDGLIGLGVAGYPTIVLTRSTSVAGTGASAENLSLTVSSTYESPVAVEGVISCTEDSQCPAGTTCAPDFRCS